MIEGKTIDGSSTDLLDILKQVGLSDNLIDKATNGIYNDTDGVQGYTDGELIGGFIKDSSLGSSGFSEALYNHKDFKDVDELGIKAEAIRDENGDFKFNDTLTNLLGDDENLTFTILFTETEKDYSADEIADLKTSENDLTVFYCNNTSGYGC
ncbi:hypothetical protein Zmor_012181 [Zophobas morio]|uniref:Uncharacterized protein n=1 Tax=Zophobas morio TaxID=2755281 RepID=A0AA38HH46_9CUCU|nr:hypothetical protein Zmor_012181 [Zophobas morio]